MWGIEITVEILRCTVKIFECLYIRYKILAINITHAFDQSFEISECCWNHIWMLMLTPWFMVLLVFTREKGNAFRAKAFPCMV